MVILLNLAAILELFSHFDSFALNFLTILTSVCIQETGIDLLQTCAPIQSDLQSTYPRGGGQYQIPLCSYKEMLDLTK